jgi:hypothetical protein
VAEGDLAAALAGNLRGRSRTLLEQLQLAGVDPRQGLAGPEGAQLLRREAELKRRVSALRARAWGAALFRFGKPRRAGACPICGGAMRGVNIEGTRLQARWEAALGRAGCRPQQMEVCAVQTGCGDLGR